MKLRTAKQGLVWGGGLILLGGLLLAETVTDLGDWVWIGFLVVAALAATGVYLADRSDWAMLITAYVLWAAVLLFVLVTLDILQDEIIAFYVLLAIAIPFLFVYYRDRKLWWALIPAYVLIAVGLMVGLIGLGVLNDLLIPSYVMFAIAIPFFFVYFRDRNLWWALIPAGIMTVIGLVFLVAEAAFAYIGALVLIVVGAVILVGVFRRKPAPEAKGGEMPEPELVVEDSGSEEGDL